MSPASRNARVRPRGPIAPAAASCCRRVSCTCPASLGVSESAIRKFVMFSAMCRDATSTARLASTGPRKLACRGMDPLAPFSEKTRSWFERAFAGPTPAQDGRLARDRDRRERADPGPDRLRQDARRVPARDRPARSRPGDGAPPALRLAAEGAQLRRRAEPARAARRDQVRPPRRRPHGRHDAEGAARAGQGAAGHPDHDARVALPDADLAGARDAARDRDGHRRRGPRRRRHQARRAPGALARAARRAAGAAGAADRPLRDPASARGDRPLRLRRPSDPARRRRHAQGARPRGRRPRRGPARARARRTSSLSRS